MCPFLLSHLRLYILWSCNPSSQHIGSFTYLVSWVSVQQTPPWRAALSVFGVPVVQNTHSLGSYHTGFSHLPPHSPPSINICFLVPSRAVVDEAPLPPSLQIHSFKSLGFLPFLLLFSLFSCFLLLLWVLLLPAYVILGTLMHLSVVQFPHMQSGEVITESMS